MGLVTMQAGLDPAVPDKESLRVTHERTLIHPNGPAVKVISLKDGGSPERPLCREWGFDMLFPLTKEEAMRARNPIQVKVVILMIAVVAAGAAAGGRRRSHQTKIL